MLNQKKSKKTFIAAIISVAMIFSMIPASAFAVDSGTAGTPSVINISTAEQLKTALGGSDTIHQVEGNSVVLSESVNLTDVNIKVTAGDLKIDLNGHEIIFGGAAFKEGIGLFGGNLTIDDRTGGENGKIATALAEAKLIYVGKGTLTLNAGKISATGTKSYGIYIKNSKSAKVVLQGKENSVAEISGKAYAIKQNGKGKVKIASAAKVTIKKTNYYYKKNLPNRKYTLIKVRYITPTPQGVKLTEKNSRTAKMKWKKVAGADGYVVYKYSSKKGKFVKIRVIRDGLKLSYNCKKLKKGVKYSFRVKAYNVVNGKKILSTYSAKKYIRL
ncbi:MAG TPA: fibronectin type III domain-containing protein [Bacillota bacterium]|nr:fibronectin type III domain-containing protein [Bacillota bacterium]HUM56508.1 fibronectin type III domain-containing protein [Bacillota bacterium]